MSDLLKEAIADAKAVRETALQNAKAALEEAFTPQIKSMLSAKLAETEDGEEDDTEEMAHEDEEEMGDDEVEAEEGHYEEGEHDEDEGEAEEGHHEDMEGDDEEEVEEGNLDLEAVIAELEAELAEGEGDDETEEGEDMEESTKSDEEPVAEAEEAISEEDELEEEYEIDEAELKEEDEDDKEVDESKLSEVQAELDEHKEAVQYLKDKLHEVNILNAKLLYTNKLFKEFSLDNNQKLKVVETFDRAQTTREIKLVYTTMAEQLNENSGVIKRKSIKESASAPVSSTKPSKESSKVISEEAVVADRFRKLAGILKG